MIAPLTRPLRLAVLIGGAGTALQALLDATRSGALPARVVVVVSHNPQATGLQRAKASRVPTCTVPLKRRHDAVERAWFEHMLLTVLEPHAVDVVVLAGWMLVLSERVLDRYPNAVVNLHPALLPGGGAATVQLSDGRRLPVFRGAHAVRDALAAGVPVTGATVHLAAPAYDTGQVLARAEVPILATDTEDTLHSRIKVVEHSLLIEALDLMARRLASPA